MNIDMGRFSVVKIKQARSHERGFGRQNTMKVGCDKPPNARE
jgi:hypothetical protein